MITSSNCVCLDMVHDWRKVNDRFEPFSSFFRLRIDNFQDSTFFPLPGLKFKSHRKPVFTKEVRIGDSV